MNPFTLKGIVTVLNTPFTEDNSIDIPSLIRHLEYALAAGVQGFLLPAMAAEVQHLDSEERMEMVSETVSHVGKKVPVIGGATSSTQLERLQMTEKLMKLGCGGILVSIPYRDEDSYKDEVREIAALEPGLLMLQDWDSSGYGIPDHVLCSLFSEIGEHLCVKIEVVPAGIKYSRLLSATEGRMHISGGWAVTQMIEGLDRGVHTFMPTGLHEIYAAVYRLYASGEREQAKNLFYRLLPVLAFSNQHLDISIFFFKRLLWRQGIYKSPITRTDSRGIDKHHLKIADELIEYAIELIKKS